MGVGSFFSKIAPWTAAAVQFAPVPFASVAAQAITAIASKHGVDVKSVQPTADSLSQAVAAIAGKPEALAELKQQEQQFQLQLQQMGFKQIEDLQKLEDDDRANARLRESTVKDRTPEVLAYLSFGVAAIVTVMVFSGNIVTVLKDPATAGLAGAIVGYVFNDLKGVYNYYFGANKGTDDQAKVLADIAKQ